MREQPARGGSTIDPLEFLLDRDLPFALATTMASLTALWALAMAARSGERARRRGYAGLAALTSLEAAGMYAARLRRARMCAGPRPVGAGAGWQRRRR